MLKHAGERVKHIAPLFAQSGDIGADHGEGQDGFWIQRALTRHGYNTLMVDPASIPVKRLSRRGAPLPAVAGYSQLFTLISGLKPSLYPGFLPRNAGFLFSRNAALASLASSVL